MNRTERAGDIEVAFDDDGKGPALVLLHPFPFDRRIWGENIPALVTSGHRVIALDYPGCGDSPESPEPLSIERLADLVAALLDRLAIDAATLLGLSMGGYVALAFAARHPDRLQAMVLANTRAASDSPAARQGRSTALTVIRDQGVDVFLGQLLPRLLAPDAPPATRTRALSLAERREATLTAGIVALRDRPDRTADLVNVRCPTLVVAGQDDQVSPAPEMRAMAAMISGARFVEIPAAGHLSNLEAPAPFNRALIGFLHAAPTVAAIKGAVRTQPSP